MVVVAGGGFGSGFLFVKVLGASPLILAFSLASSPAHFASKMLSFVVWASC